MGLHTVLPGGNAQHRLRMAACLAACVAVALCACAVAPSASAEPPEPSEGLPGKHRVVAVTSNGEVLRFNIGQPKRVLDRKPLLGLEVGDRLVGIDYRVARGQLYALSAQGRLYTLDVGSGKLTAVGAGTKLDLGAQPVGFDFNPVADRIRVVDGQGRNWRLHPDTGAVAAQDAELKYAGAEAAQSRKPRLAAAAYSYNKINDKITTNYAVDLARMALVRQGSMEGVMPVVSPNTGELRDVGALGVSPATDAAFDIADVDNAAVLALVTGGRTRLYSVDLGTGRATLVGSIAEGQPLWGMAIEP